MRAVQPVFHDDHDVRTTHIEWVPAKSPGVACSVECATLVRVRSSVETPDERRLTSWRWRQRHAQANGRPFDEAPPMDEAERGMVLRLAAWKARGFEWDGERFIRRLRLVTHEAQP
jgi:hypothetical protein